MLLLVALLAALAGGGTAVVVGFGVGSMLTPLLAVEAGAKVAVALVAIPHLTASAVRYWRLRADVNRDVLWRFGTFSAAGGLVGALHGLVASAVVRAVFGGLLVLAGASGLIGLADRIRFRGRSAWAAGSVSGVLGGLSGAQGGIRSAALLGFDLRRQAFIATSTAVGLLIDLARTPVYLATQGGEIVERWPLVLVMVGGVVAGTLVGERVLRAVPEAVFRRVVSAVILVLGVAMFFLPGG
jgi:uncharacterized protein